MGRQRWCFHSMACIRGKLNNRLFCGSTLQAEAALHKCDAVRAAMILIAISRHLRMRIGGLTWSGMCASVSLTGLREIKRKNKNKNKA